MPKYLSNVDLNRNQLQNAVIQPLGTAPTSPVTGLIYYNTTTNRFYGYNGTDWIPMDALGATMTGANIVTALNLSTSIIDNDNLSTGVNTAITKAHDAVTVSDTSSVNLTLTGQAISADVIFGTTATTATAGNDARLSNSRTPTAHANTHITSGSDAIPSFTSTASGLVPLSGGGTVKYLRADGTWVTPPDTTYSLATTTVAGLMAFADKVKLDGIATGATANLGTVTAVTATAPVVSTGGTTPVLSMAKATASVDGYMSKEYSAKLDGISASADVNQNAFSTVVVSGQTSVVADTETDSLTLVAGSNVSITTDATTDAITISSTNTTYPVFNTTTNGLVPLTTTSNTTDYLRKDGTWATPPNTVYSLPVASATLGGVKSGTDITVDASGNVSVVDDSHNHVVANIDGLSTTLATFATTTVAQGYATTAENNAKGYADTAITNLLGSAPATLDTLNELATALGNDPNFATTIATNIAGKTSKYTATVGDGVALSYVITHNKNSRDVVVALRETVAPYATVYTDIEMTTVNTVTVYFSTAPTAGQYTITVIG